MARPLLPPGPAGLKFWRPPADQPSAVIAANLILTQGNPIDLLLHLDGTDGATAVLDSGGYGRTVTAHGAAQIDTGQAVFAGQALLLAADTDYLSVDSGDFAFGTGDFCIDLRARLPSGVTAQMFYDGGDDGPRIYYDGALKFESAAGVITGGTLAADTNYHIAATRAGTSTRLWLDGAAARQHAHGCN